MGIRKAKNKLYLKLQYPTATRTLLPRKSGFLDIRAMAKVVAIYDENSTPINVIGLLYGGGVAVEAFSQALWTLVEVSGIACAHEIVPATYGSTPP
ncbi:hypothetical protein [Pandoraea communis]|uniref:hypothetical protein n=1 Tax=Pandoraea communis TaxID=2508297 RepID=UPI0025A5EDAF|nr:hypothetical protein [Pandoraea communis]MDM8356178.1 hypothetical protein [Pandoraea communis]